MSTPPSGGGGGGGIIIDEAVTKLLVTPAVAAILPPLVRSTMRSVLVKPSTTWSDDDRWYVAQAIAWLVCNAK